MPDRKHRDPVQTRRVRSTRSGGTRNFPDSVVGSEGNVPFAEKTERREARDSEQRGLRHEK